MRADASATDILALLSLLPDGFPNREGMLDRLQSYLPPEVNLHKAVSTLRRVALVHGETLANTPRLRSLSPVRLFSQANLRIPPRLRTALVDLYIDLLIEGRDYSVPNSHVFIPPEFLNIRSVFMDAYKTGDRREALIKASIIYTDWLPIRVGSAARVVFLLAWQVVHAPERLSKEAHQAFARAIELHIQAQDATGEAYDLYELGGLYIWWGKLEKAEESFKRAMKLHARPWALLDLGKLLMRRGKLEEAENATSTALELLKESHDVLGQAHALRRLGGVYMRQDKLDEAEEALCEAVKLHQQTSCILGEAHDMRRLGGLYMWRHQLDDAETSFIKAADLIEHRTISWESTPWACTLRTQNVLGRANVMQMQGALHISKKELVEAGSFLSEAVQLHRQAGDILGLAKDWQKIGEMHELGKEIDEAEEAYSKAVEFHQQACNRAGQAYGLKSLAELYTQRGELQVAMKLLIRAAELRARISSAEVAGELDMELRLRELEQRCKSEGYG
ncbi:hypothetical protein FB45DRAFT_1032562 [Roridomyces roridus]|uniref:Tetratricopeptide repeat protein 29 n=1 Tax=Roridomyces roridus TaxID=1738132 RepID=A0AAD7BI79_9AGAR|nr:hypothetical protein FB45DRAFT_1032562 [Roridomyces roridus]